MIEAKCIKYIWGMKMTNLFCLWRESHYRMLMEVKWSRLLHTILGLSKNFWLPGSPLMLADVDRKQQEDAGVALKTDA
jgi:hypothetical protein